MAFDYCNSTLPEHESIACGNWLKSGIDSVAILECDHSITDFTSSTQWNAAIAAGEATIVKQTKGELPTPSKIDGDNPVGGGTESIADGISWILNLADSNVNVNNDGFWEQINKRQTYIAIHSPNADEIYVVEQQVSIFAAPTVPGGAGKENQRYDVEFTWESNVDEFYDRYTAPSGIFAA